MRHSMVIRAFERERITQLGHLLASHYRGKEEKLPRPICPAVSNAPDDDCNRIKAQQVAFDFALQAELCLSTVFSRL